MGTEMGILVRDPDQPEQVTFVLSFVTRGDLVGVIIPPSQPSGQMRWFPLTEVEMVSVRYNEPWYAPMLQKVIE